ncbi:salivary peroxidase/catechol oxidase-like [Aphomia sociella]
MLAKYILGLLLVQVLVAQVIYDAYFGKPLNENRRSLLTSLNITGPCTIAVEPCKKHEGRRVDGTCVNPKFPSRGGSPTPMLRMLPARFGLGNTLQPASNGSELPSTRELRVKILSDGFPEDRRFTALASFFLVTSVIDVADLLVLLRFVVVSECCIGNTPNRLSPQCIPISVPQDDPYLRQTGIRCMNLTRFPTYQELGCIPNSLPAERYNTPTPLTDLSIVYGFTNERERQVRTYEGGLLRSEMRNGIERPPGTAPFCVNNQLPAENSCYEYGDSYGSNLLLTGSITTMWFYREHNRLTRKLAQVNPCWDDQTLFETARQINIAQFQYILYYELYAEILGRQNALATGVIYNTKGYVNDFDERYKPGVYHEYVVGTRWFHVMQDGRTDLYSNNGKFLGSRTTVDDELRSGVFEVNNTEADLTQGAFRRPSSKIDDVLDPDMAERIFGEFQRAADIGAIDMMRGRDQGLASYNSYRKICGLPVARKFKDFEDTINPDKVEQLRRIYEEIDDVEVMAAIYSERILKDAWVGPTLFCIIVRNLVEWRKSDRHFFEHGDIPTALTLPQLNQVRKTSIARVLCDSGDRVDHIQPYAFYQAGKGNEITSCKNIPGIDLTEWSDPKCHPKLDKDESPLKKRSSYGICLKLTALNVKLGQIELRAIKAESSLDGLTAKKPGHPMETGGMQIFRHHPQKGRYFNR